MTIKTSIKKHEKKELINIQFLEDENIVNEYLFDLEDEKIDNIQDMFEYILENIKIDWKFVNDLDISIDTTINKIAIKYSELLEKEINGIKEELKNSCLI